MRRVPVPASKEDLLETLRELVALVETDDSFEGSLEYLMPQPRSDHAVQPEPANPVLDTATPELEGKMTIWQCKTCGMATESEQWLRELHAGDPTTTANGERAVFMLTAAYRMGNAMGQGGMRIIGEFR